MTYLRSQSQSKNSKPRSRISTVRLNTPHMSHNRAIKRTEFAFMFSHPLAIASGKVSGTFRATVFSFKINIAGPAYLESCFNSQRKHCVVQHETLLLMLSTSSLKISLEKNV